MIFVNLWILLCLCGDPESKDVKALHCDKRCFLYEIVCVFRTVLTLFAKIPTLFANRYTKRFRCFGHVIRLPYSNLKWSNNTVFQFAVICWMILMLLEPLEPLRLPSQAWMKHQGWYKRLAKSESPKHPRHRNQWSFLPETNEFSLKVDGWKIRFDFISGPTFGLFS